MNIQSRSIQQTSTRLPGLTGVTLLGIAVYVALDVVLGFLPPHYSVIHQPESDYGVGPYGYLMGINFIVRGVFSLALVVALWEVFSSRPTRIGAALLGIWAVASMLLAAFPTDVEGATATAHGRLHVLFALVAFLAVLVGEIALSQSGRQNARWQRVIAAPRVLAWLALPANLWLVVALGKHTADSGTAGLAERLFLALVIAWMGLVAYRLRQVMAESAARSQGTSASA
jgi:hypothetical membrane protein